jgi:hypothetical protein
MYLFRSPDNLRGFLIFGMLMITPQPGFQTKVLSTPADIAWIGGSAGGGKTFVNLLEASRHTNNPEFGFTAFRRTTQQIKNQGGLWETGKKLFLPLGATTRETSLEFIFPSGAKGKFAHLEHEKDAENYQGAQIPLIIFDELTHFTEYQYWYLVSRNRTDCGVKPYLRASCNPLPDSWVSRFIEWWIDQDTGFAIPERSGVVRYYTRDGEAVVWGDSKQEVVDQCPHIFSNEALVESGVKIEDLVKSFTFIAGTIYENKIFIKQDPGYLGTLLSLQPEERLRLLDGNWKISLDGLNIAEHAMIERIFDNYPEQSPNARRAITVDAARFGRDFCVIKVWIGWEVVFMVVMKLSDAHDIVKQIELLRAKFFVSKENTIVDQDGVGDGTVKLGGYTGFHGGAAALKDPDSRIKENYENLKTQCYYRFCQLRINTGQIRYSINNETCLIFDGSSVNGLLTTKIKMGNVVKDVRDLIKADFKSVKRRERKNEGVDKICMITKEEQKNLLKRSPDFGDCAMMIEYLELKGERRFMKKTN